MVYFFFDETDFIWLIFAMPENQGRIGGFASSSILSGRDLLSNTKSFERVVGNQVNWVVFIKVALDWMN